MRKGFSLIEMIIAVFLSTLVLLAIIAVSSSMIRQHFQSVSQGELSGDTLLSLDQMNHEIEEASTLVAPNAAYGTTPSDVVAGCVNWSMNGIFTTSGAYGQLNTVQPVQGFYYCAASAANPNAYTLWRYSCSVCPPPAPASCGQAAPAGCSGPTAVVYNALYLESTYSNFFFQVPGGIAIHYLVGNPVSTAQQPHPVSYQIDNIIMMQKAYSNTSD